MRTVLCLFFTSTILFGISSCSPNEPTDLVSNRAAQDKNIASTTKSIELPTELKNYKQWNKLGTEIDVLETRFVQCTTTGQIIRPAPYQDRGLHKGYSINVFANSIAQSSFDKKSALLTAGSIVVKEKMKNGKIVAVAAMIKKELGFHESGNNWEYFYSQNGEPLIRGIIETCQTCHATAAKTDFIFKNY